MKILVLNGPNMDMLGIREPEVYGRQTYADLETMVRDHAAVRGVEVELYQSNHEGDLIDAIRKAYCDKVDGIVFNPAAYTHTSIALADAVAGAGIPTVEVHVTDLTHREAFRQISYVRAAAVATVMGRGLAGYLEAMDLLIERAGGHGR